MFSQYVLNTVRDSLTKFEERDGITYKLTPVIVNNIFKTLKKDIKFEMIDGERFMNKIIFESMFMLSKPPVGFEERLTFQLPFTCSEFDNFYANFSGSEIYNEVSFVDFLVLCDFLMAKNDCVFEWVSFGSFPAGGGLLELKKRYDMNFTDMPVSEKIIRVLVEYFCRKFFSSDLKIIEQNEKIYRDPLFLECYSKFSLETEWQIFGKMALAHLSFLEKFANETGDLDDVKSVVLTRSIKYYDGILALIPILPPEVSEERDRLVQELKKISGEGTLPEGPNPYPPFGFHIDPETEETIRAHTARLNHYQTIRQATENTGNYPNHAVRLTFGLDDFNQTIRQATGELRIFPAPSPDFSSFFPEKITEDSEDL